jgi:3-methylcrotonyl-CoA carboxylase alpha subunit
VGTQAFGSADLDTALIERERDALFGAAALPLALAASGAVAHTLRIEQAGQTADPWSRRDGWRLHGGARRRFELELGGERRTVHVQRRHDGATVLAIDGAEWPFAARPLPGARHDVQLGGQTQTLAVYARGERYAVFAEAGSALATEVDLIAHAGDHAGEGGRLTAPMPGKVVSFLAQPGQAVSRGQPLAVMEAMKMEHTLAAPHDGVVEALFFAVGDQVAEGSELLKLAAAA